MEIIHLRAREKRGTKHEAKAIKERKGLRVKAKAKENAKFKYDYKVHPRAARQKTL
jgi:hypothetical protein